MTNSPVSEESSATRPSIVPLLGILAVAALLFLLGLGNLGLTDRDEGSNAEAGREMLESGDWLSPTLNYEPRFAKPAFVYWILSGSYALFGVHEFAARLPSALFGIGLILLHYRFLLRVCGPFPALFGALMLLLNIEVIAINRMVLTDPELVFFTTLAGYSFWLGMHGEGQGRSRLYFWGFYIGMALAMLAKGPVGIVIPLLAVIPYLIITRQWRRFREIGYPFLGTLVFLLIAAPWYLAMFATHGAEYAAAAQANTTGRFANPMEGHGGTLFFYVPVLLFGFFPWSGFLPVALHQALKDWKQYRSGEKKPEAEHGLALFAGLWCVGIFIFFSLSATRLPHYLFALFPAASILTTLYWSRCLREPSPPGLTVSIRIILISGYVFGIALAAAPAIYKMFVNTIAKEFPAAAHVEPGLMPVIMGAIVLIGVIGMRRLAYSEEKRPATFWVGGGMIASMALVAIIFGLPKFSTFFIVPPQELATIAGFNLGPDDRLIQFGNKRPSLVFYAKRKVYQISPGEDERFEPHLNNPGRKMVILQAHLRSKLPAPVSDWPVVLERHGFSLLSSEAVVTR